MKIPPSIDKAIADHGISIDEMYENISSVKGPQYAAFLSAHVAMISTLHLATACMCNIHSKRGMDTLVAMNALQATISMIEPFFALQFPGQENKSRRGAACDEFYSMLTSIVKRNDKTEKDINALYEQASKNQKHGDGKEEGGKSNN